MNIGDDSHEKELRVCRVSLGAFTCKYTYSLACEREDSGGQYLSITLHAILGEARHFLAGNVGHKFHQDFTPKCILRSLPFPSVQRGLVPSGLSESTLYRKKAEPVPIDNKHCIKRGNKESLKRKNCVHFL